MAELDAQNVVRMFEALDAKINAVAAYVREMPGATSVDVERVNAILKDRAVWDNPKRFPIGRPPSPSEAMSHIVGVMKQGSDHT